MKIQRVFFAMALVTLMVLASCTEPSTNHDVNVSDFSFKTSTLAPDLKSITYTIDTINNLIYNVDSAAYTSDLSRVVPVVTCYSTPSEIRINDNAWNQTDSVDVRSPFKLTIVGSDKKTTRDFTVTIIQHTVDSRKITWTQLDLTGFDVEFTDGKAVIQDGIFYFIGSVSGEGERLYSSVDAKTWSLVKSYSDSPFKIATVYAVAGAYAPDSIYAVSTDGSKILMVDKTSGSVSQVASMPDGVTAEDIVGEAKDKIIIQASKSSTDCFVYLFDGKALGSPVYSSVELPKACTAAKCNVFIDATKTADAASSYLVAGQTTSSEYTQRVLASSDGRYWASLLKDVSYSFVAIKNAAVVWYDKRLFMIGGQTSSQTILPQYVSSDTGYSWSASSSAEVLPSTCELSYGISALFSPKDDCMYVIGGHTNSGAYKVQCFKGLAVHKSFIIQ